MSAVIQHQGARKLLDLIRYRTTRDAILTYADAAERIGRKRGDARAVAQMCDLLDAAAAYSRTPLLALTAVRASSGIVNPKAWGSADVPQGIRQIIVDRSESWAFTQKDFDAIAHGLDALTGLGNRAAWKKLRAEVAPVKLYDFVAGLMPFVGNDVDVGAIEGDQRLTAHLRRERDPTISRDKRREAMTPDGLECEACKTRSKKQYPGIEAALWEVHHRLPLSEADKPVKTRLKDLAILCPSCHRAIHRTKPMLTVADFSLRFFPSA